MTVCRIGLRLHFVHQFGVNSKHGSVFLELETGSSPKTLRV